MKIKSKSESIPSSGKRRLGESGKTRDSSRVSDCSGEVGSVAAVTEHGVVSGGWNRRLVVVIGDGGRGRLWWRRGW
jgi:hypothetical protein